MFPAIIVTLDTAIKCLSQLVSDISISYRWKLSDSAMCPAPTVLFLVNYLKTQWQHTVIYWLLQLLQEWVKIIFKDSFMFQIVRMWDGFRPNQTGEQAKTLSDEFWTAIKARSKPRTDVFLKVSTELRRFHNNVLLRVIPTEVVEKAANSDM